MTLRKIIGGWRGIHLVEGGYRWMEQSSDKERLAAVLLALRSPRQKCGTRAVHKHFLSILQR